MISFIFKNMINVTLHGVLGKKLGKDWLLDVESIIEIFEAIEANNIKINKYFSDINKFVSHFIVYVDGKIIPYYLLKSKILKTDSKVDIVPVIQGGWLVAIGIILIALSVVLMVIMSPKLPKDIKTNSTILGGVRNVLNRNIPVPLGYGRFRIGSAVISNDVIVTKINDDNNYLSTYQTQNL